MLRMIVVRGLRLRMRVPVRAREGWAARAPRLACAYATSPGPAASTPPTPAPTQTPAPVPRAPLTATERFKDVLKKYGWVALGVHSTVYATTLSSMALLVHNGVDVVGVFKALGLDRIVDLGSLNPSLGPSVHTARALLQWALTTAWTRGGTRTHTHTGTLVVAFVATKLTSPVRLFVTVTLTPAVARALRRGR
jgi:hypothetical protein